MRKVTLLVIILGLMMTACSSGLPLAATPVQSATIVLTSTPIAPPPTDTAVPPAPTDTPNPPASTPTIPPATAPIGPSGICPTTQEAKNLTGVDVQRLATEPCAWVWRGVSPATTTAICPRGWICTFDVVGDIVVVHVGVDQSAKIRAATWRLPSAYPATDAVHDPCALFAKEKAFGASEIPSFDVRFQAATDGSGTPVGPRSCP